jgi:hypothetical protein
VNRSSSWGSRWGTSLLLLLLLLDVLLVVSVLLPLLVSSHVCLLLLLLLLLVPIAGSGVCSRFGWTDVLLAEGAQLQGVEVLYADTAGGTKCRKAPLAPDVVAACCSSSGRQLLSLL